MMVARHTSPIIRQRKLFIFIKFFLELGEGNIPTFTIITVLVQGTKLIFHYLMRLIRIYFFNAIQNVFVFLDSPEVTVLITNMVFFKTINDLRSDF